MYELKITNKRENQINELIIRKGGKARKHSINKVFVRMFLRFRIMRYGTGYAIPHFLSRE